MSLTTGIIETSQFHIDQSGIKAEEDEIRLAQSNPKAFEPLYLRYYERICQYIYHRVENKELTFDIASNIFYNALKNISKYKSQGVPFSAWLFRIAFNEIQQYYRRSKKEAVLTISEYGISNIIENLTENSYPVTDAQLFNAIEQLKEDEIELINMRFFESRSFKEVADILGMGESACKMKLYRILEKIKNTFNENK